MISMRNRKHILCQQIGCYNIHESNGLCRKHNERLARGKNISNDIYDMDKRVFVDNMDSISTKNTVYDTIEKEDVRFGLYEYLGSLDNEREIMVLCMRFGLFDDEPRILEYVGKQFNVTRERIRNIEAHAFKKLRHPYRVKIIKKYINKNIIRR